MNEHRIDEDEIDLRDYINIILKKKWGIFTQWTFGDVTFFFKNGKLFEWEEIKKDKKDK
ncbi:MAG: hypothetical protein IIB83_09140 [Bacteroidetes bacterium]|nr:hypothetical protein [Bacteroidota bacterium]